MDTQKLCLAYTKDTHKHIYILNHADEKKMKQYIIYLTQLRPNSKHDRTKNQREVTYQPTCQSSICYLPLLMTTTPSLQFAGGIYSKLYTQWNSNWYTSRNLSMMGSRSLYISSSLPLIQHLNISLPLHYLIPFSLYSLYPHLSLLIISPSHSLFSYTASSQSLYYNLFKYNLLPSMHTYNNVMC